MMFNFCNTMLAQENARLQGRVCELEQKLMDAERRIFDLQHKAKPEPIEVTAARIIIKDWESERK